jgi:hypothetical protein
MNMQRGFFGNKILNNKNPKILSQIELSIGIKESRTKTKIMTYKPKIFRTRNFCVNGNTCESISSFS